MPLTFLFVVFAWVMFRSPDLPTTLLFWKGMLGAGGIELPEAAHRLIGISGGGWLSFNNLPYRYLWQSAGNMGAFALIAGLLFAIAVPRQNPPANWNILERTPRVLELPSALAVFVVFLLAFYLKDVNAPFLYFQF
jgi:alginate O-acetyltransferase complex protein AlgI